MISTVFEAGGMPDTGLTLIGEARPISCPRFERPGKHGNFQRYGTAFASTPGRRSSDGALHFIQFASDAIVAMQEAQRPIYIARILEITFIVLPAARAANMGDLGG